MSEVTAVILAAGEGKRMRSRHPKVLHRLCGRPLLDYALRAVGALASRIVLVVGPDAGEVLALAGAGVRAVEQRERRGTGDAVRRAREACGAGTILVVPGDVPLLGAETLAALARRHEASGAAATVLTAVVDAPRGYGRVLRQDGRVTAIVEERDATDAQRAVREINTSVYAFRAPDLWGALEQVRPDNDQGEYYLTDVIGILVRGGRPVGALAVADPVEALGVNDRRQLAALAAVQRARILDRLMEAGVTVVDPATTHVDDTVTIGPDTVLGPGVVIEGATTIGRDCVIGPGCQLAGCQLGEGVLLRPYCVLRQAVVEDGAQLGPFCHLRPEAHIGPGAHIGNFVEVKKSRLGRGAKANHLAYIGDATVGERVNIGAGVITCNYDGVAKHRTSIGDGAFVGTNASLVAPITIGEGAYVAAGSVVTKDVPPGALAVERSQQLVKEGWAARRAQRRAAAPGE